MNSNNNILPNTKKDIFNGSCSLKTVRKAQQYFVGLLFSTIFICVYMEIFLLPQNIPFSGPPHVKEKYFITVECGDGRRLGNIMFSYASLIGIARRLNLTALMPDSFRLPSIFKVKAALSNNVENSLGMYKNFEEYGRRACAYDFNVERISSVPTRLLGYFQSWKYFENAEAEVRDEFQLQPEVLRAAISFLNLEVLSSRDRKQTVLVGIHVRRGDITQDYYKNYGYTTPERDYYINAVRYIKDKFGDGITFIVCSDDINWAKRNLAGIDKDMIFSEGKSDSTDLAILIQCDHVIISVGSFGWWAGWLAGGTVVYYDKWPREYSMLEYHVTKHHYFPSTWVSLR